MFTYTDTCRTAIWLELSAGIAVVVIKVAMPYPIPLAVIVDVSVLAIRETFKWFGRIDWSLWDVPIHQFTSLLQRTDR